MFYQIVHIFHCYFLILYLKKILTFMEVGVCIVDMYIYSVDRLGNRNFRP